MARNKLTLPCMGNSRLFASTGEHESVALKQHEAGPVVPDVRAYSGHTDVEGEDNSREFDRMMRGNQGVL